jgi:hypothetical protein
LTSKLLKKPLRRGESSGSSSNDLNLSPVLNSHVLSLNP